MTGDLVWRGGSRDFLLIADSRFRPCLPLPAERAHPSSPRWVGYLCRREGCSTLRRVGPGLLVVCRFVGTGVVRTRDARELSGRGQRRRGYGSDEQELARRPTMPRKETCFSPAFCSRGCRTCSRASLAVVAGWTRGPRRSCRRSRSPNAGAIGRSSS